MLNLPSAARSSFPNTSMNGQRGSPLRDEVDRHIWSDEGLIHNITIYLLATPCSTSSPVGKKSLKQKNCTIEVPSSRFLFVSYLRIIRSEQFYCWGLCCSRCITFQLQLLCISHLCSDRVDSGSELSTWIFIWKFSTLVQDSNEICLHNNQTNIFKHSRKPFVRRFSSRLKWIPFD